MRSNWGGVLATRSSLMSTWGERGRPVASTRTLNGFKQDRLARMSPAERANFDATASRYTSGDRRGRQGPRRPGSGGTQPATAGISHDYEPGSRREAGGRRRRRHVDDAAESRDRAESHGHDRAVGSELMDLRPEWRDKCAAEKAERLAELGIPQDFAATP
jgi:hypothetical protein